MAEKNDQQNSQMPPAPAPATPPAMIIASDAQVQRDREQGVFDRKLAADDKRRAEAGTSTLIAVTDFTIHDNADHENGRVVHRGEEFDVSNVDLEKYLGKGRLKVLDGDTAATQGVSIITGG